MTVPTNGAVTLQAFHPTAPTLLGWQSYTDTRSITVAGVGFTYSIIMGTSTQILGFPAT